jgi:putative hydrolase of the HAD superfamily
VALRGLTTAPRAVLFDALGTLVELEPPAPRLRGELSSRFGLAVSQAQAERAIGAEITYYRAHLSEGRDDASLAELRARCAEVLSRELGRILNRAVPAGPEMVDALLASLSFSAFADARPTLDRLRALGLRLVVVSNWDVSLAEVLSRVGLGEGLDEVVTSAGTGVAKPDPVIFQRGLAAAGVAAGEAIHVGDSVREDVGGARAAGIEPVLVDRGQVAVHAPEREAVTIRTLSELPGLVRPADREADV